MEKHKAEPMVYWEFAVEGAGLQELLEGAFRDWLGAYLDQENANG